MAINLTELESAVLGAIRQMQPCSAYQVRRAFARAATREWSDSAGSIYPVIARLERLKLVRARAKADDTRGRRDLRLTKSGEAALKGWILGLASASSTPDPVRTRLHFLELLGGKRERMAFLVRAETLTRRAIDETRAFLKEERANAEIDYLASLGGLYQLQARLKWLAKVRAALSLP